MIMETWKATIKENDYDVLLTPEYSFPEGGMFSGITDERQREYETRKFLIKFWGLEEPNVEWYVLKKTEE
jgi:hypothetical protein